MDAALAIGVVGCGHISARYLSLAPRFRGIEIRACADLDGDAAAARAARFGLRASTVDELLADPDIDLVLNLTPPAAHFELSLRALAAGKHVYSEKPLAPDPAAAATLAREAAARGLRLGAAPDTFLGGAQQLARQLLDSGAVGAITSGTCFVQGPGMEMWHANPDFFYQPGGGPVLDLGPYSVACLVALLGPVRRVGAMGSRGRAERVITSAPRHGERIRVEVDTTVHALLEFSSGAQITFCASWDVWHHAHAPMELYGERGTLHLPDPNFHGGEVRMTDGPEPVDLPAGPAHPFAAANDEEGRANYRGAGLADLAAGLRDRRPHRCGPEFTVHVIDILTAILASAEHGRFVDIASRCPRPAALGAGEAGDLLV